MNWRLWLRILVIDCRESGSDWLEPKKYRRIRTNTWVALIRRGFVAPLEKGRFKLLLNERPYEKPVAA